MNWKIPLFKIHSDKNDLDYVSRVIKRGSFWAIGPEVKDFEENIAEYIGTKYAVVFNSGTSALHALMIAYGISETDELIVPSFTFISTANAPQFTRSKPVFAEIEENTFGLDPEDVNEKITSKTKAILPIHYGGCPCQIRELREIADDHNLLLIEDAAEAMGSKLNNKKIGTFGDSAMFSFCQNKIISTGEGGAITTESDDIYNKLQLILSHGRQDTENYFSSAKSMDYVMLGHNFRMSSIIAALGLSQLQKIDDNISLRREKANYLNNKLSHLSNISLPVFSDDYYCVYQMYTIRVKNNLRDSLSTYLSNKGIMTKIYFPPVHLTSFYKSSFGYKSGYLPITEKVSKEVLSLPIYPSITFEEMDYIIKCISDFFEGV
ncbi:DegT/DnrJ/EryC1/StrS aminotransferase family protein [Methanococcoides methylutens]|uniref:Bacillosamine/Legionaminic acid biosynthesis aminotransferase PglE n=1 Tax=Methanococcoides methylutens MM1 TaxID=1434104 RepID=A0A0E3X0H8_METMT|nr:DegT/DnrJ/EryC1/StrS family aminotransferase [Methanococcoides methylutens]AKB84295.1 Bacillosamine/Legionaminic acid biosynthesis aminotransferase PglE [Methanococcoides methylutens MM1]